MRESGILRRGFAGDAYLLLPDGDVPSPLGGPRLTFGAGDVESRAKPVGCSVGRRLSASLDYRLLVTAPAIRTHRGAGLGTCRQLTTASTGGVVRVPPAPCVPSTRETFNLPRCARPRECPGARVTSAPAKAASKKTSGTRHFSGAACSSRTLNWRSIGATFWLSEAYRPSRATIMPRQQIPAVGRLFAELGDAFVVGHERASPVRSPQRLGQRRHGRERMLTVAAFESAAEMPVDVMLARKRWMTIRRPCPQLWIYLLP